MQHRASALLVARVADMDGVHPKMDWEHVCARCNTTVGIYPSGQKYLAMRPHAEIVCSVCHDDSDDRGVAAMPLPGVVQELRESIPNPLRSKPS